MSDLTQVDQPGVTDEKQPRFPEGSLDLVGECPRGEAACNGGTPHVPENQKPGVNKKPKNQKVRLDHSSHLANFRTAL